MTTRRESGATLKRMCAVAPDVLFAVTGSTRPYVYDLPHLLSLPAGFEFRFRYRHTWIDPALWPAIEKNPTSFIGKTLIILFHSREQKRLLPVRKCTIVRVEEFGPLIYIRFQLGQFLKNDLNIRSLASDDKSAVLRQSATWHSMAETLMAYPAAEGTPKLDLGEALPNGWYMRGTTTAGGLQWAGLATKDVADAWGGLATVLQDEKQLKGVPLFYLLGFEDADREFVPAAAVRNRIGPRTSQVRGFRLVEKERYRLRLLTWNGSYPRAAEMKVNCQFDPTVLSLEGASDLVLGRYDVLEFTFVGSKSGYTEVGISAEPVEPKTTASQKEAAKTETAIAEESWKTWPAIYLARIPVSVRLNIPRTATVGLLAMAGLALYLAAPVYLPKMWGGILAGFVPGLQALGLLITFICVSGITEKLIKVREHVIKLAEKPKLPAP